MSKITCTVAFTLASLSIPFSCSRGNSGKASEEVLVVNPRYAHWAQFKPGSYSVLQMVVTMARHQAQSFSRVTLKEVSETGVVIETQLTWHLVPDEKDVPPEREFIPAQIAESAAERQEASNWKVTEGEEELEHGSETLTTHWVETNKEQGILNTLSKVWYCDDVPNRVVKETVSMKAPPHGRPPTTQFMDIEKTLVEFKIVQ